MNWNYGLELARCIAIVLVLISHGIHLLFNADGGVGPIIQSVFYSFFKPGWWGVRIFFALSGYLIGNQAIKILNRSNFGDAIRFTLRRWLRTIPTYWIILLIACIINGISLTSWQAISNSLFLQTINPEVASNSSILPVSWSLAIEEWSYLIVSAALISLTFKRSKSKSNKSPTNGARKILGVAIFLCSLAMTLRADWSLTSQFDWGALKKTAPLQLDSLSAGLALASFQSLRPKAFTRLTNNPATIFTITITLMSVTGFAINRNYIGVNEVNTTTSLALSIIIYPISSILSALFLLSLWSYKPVKPNSPQQKLISGAATVSYSLYMTHLWALDITAKAIQTQNPYILFSSYIILSFAIAWLCWIIAELPFLKARDALRNINKSA